MASFVASSSSVVATPSAFASSSPSAVSSASDSPSALSFTGLRANTFAGKEASLSSKTVSNGSRVSCMLVWPPYNNKKFETLSYLPPLTQEQIAKQVDYITRKGWIPCLEFDKIGNVYREHFHGSGYYDGRYWIMWKLPMFGCTDSAVVLREINECKKEYPTAFIRVLGFDAKRQVQVCGFLVHKPT